MEVWRSGEMNGYRDGGMDGREIEGWMYGEVDGEEMEEKSGFSNGGMKDGGVKPDAGALQMWRLWEWRG